MLREELEETAERYRDCIFAIAYNYMKNSYDADDITQNVLIKYYNNKKVLESEEHKKNWLIRVTINECKKMLLSPWRSRCQNLEDYADSLHSVSYTHLDVYKRQVQEFDQEEEKEIEEIKKKYKLDFS